LPPTPPILGLWLAYAGGRGGCGAKTTLKSADPDSGGQRRVGQQVNNCKLLVV